MSDFTLTFLGTGTSQGVPVIACDCAVCRSRDPRDKRTRASVYIETPEAAFVVDTGPDFRLQALREGIHRMDAVVYTHAHTDHIMGFDDLRPFCWNMRELPIYASADTLDNLKRAFYFAFNGENRWPGYVFPLPHVVDGPFRLGETELTPLPVPHGRTTTTGYLFSRHGKKLVAYLSDCKAVSDAIAEQIAGVSVLIIDALRHKPHPTHLNVEEALEAVTRIQPGETWFTHLCHDLAHAETEASLPSGVRIAYDGLRLTPMADGQ